MNNYSYFWIVKAKKEQKEDRIFDAALELIGEVGLAGLSMEGIGKRAKMATGTLYLYFKSKEELLNELYRRTKLVFIREIFKPCAEGTPMRLCFRRVCYDFMDYLMGHNGELVFMHQFVNSPDLSEATRLDTLGYMRPLYDLLEQGKREMLLKDLDTDFMILYINGSLNSIAGILKRNPELDRAQYYEAAATVCWDGLKL